MILRVSLEFPVTIWRQRDTKSLLYGDSFSADLTPDITPNF
jgi:hypothetical protein